MDELGYTTSEKLTNAVQSLLKTPLNPQLYFLPPDTEVETYFRKVDEFDNDYWLDQDYQKIGGIVMGLVMGLWCSFIIYSSIYNEDSQVTLQRSMNDLLKKRQVDSVEARDLLMFDGFRVLCLIWILSFGVAQFTMGGAAYNPWTLQDYFQTVEYTLVYSANFGFDEFFMLSSLFAYLKLTKYISKKGSFSFGDFLKVYAGRFLRLVPVYYAIFLCGWLIGPYLASGPWWYTYQMGFCDCQHYWWSVFTMTINEWPGYVVANEGCFYWGWFVAAEM